MVVQLDRTGQITYINPATQTITGYCLEDLPEPASWQGLLHAEDFQKLQSVFPDVLAGQTVQMELRYTAKDGSQKVGHVILQPRRPDGETTSVTALIVDMTVQRRLEQDLQRAQRLEFVERLASGIAHDFNNLLTVVLTLTELARDNVPADHPAYASLLHAFEAEQQAAHLAEQLLAIGKQKHVNCQPIEVNDVARRTLRLLRSTLPSSVVLQPALHEGELHVQADDTQLQQVLMNLCFNAHDAMPQGGRLVVRTAAGDAPDTEHETQEPAFAPSPCPLPGGEGRVRGGSGLHIRRGYRARHCRGPQGEDLRSLLLHQGARQWAGVGRGPANRRKLRWLHCRAQPAGRRFLFRCLVASRSVPTITISGSGSQVSERVRISFQWLAATRSLRSGAA